MEEGEGGPTGGQRLVPAAEFRSEGGEDGMVSSAPLLSSQSEKSHMQTVQATSGTLVYLSALLSWAPSSYKSACLGERCSNHHPPLFLPPQFHPYPSKANPQVCLPYF